MNRREQLAQLPGAVKLTAALLGIAGTVIAAFGWSARTYAEARETFERVPRQVDTLAAVVLHGPHANDSLARRVGALEVQVDTLGALVPAVQSARREVGEVRETVDRIVCLIELQQGVRRPLDCR